MNVDTSGKFVSLRKFDDDDAMTHVLHTSDRKASDCQECAPMFLPCDATTLVAQIGRINVCAISGGRVVVRDTGVTLPVGRGYSVTVDLAGNDTYTVRRMFKRGEKVWIKGERDNVYADEVGEAAYVASCYVNRVFP